MSEWRRRRACCERVTSLLNWLRYADYLMAWDTVPLGERPRYRVAMIRGEWKAVLA